MVIACRRRGGPITSDVFEQACAITLIWMANVNAVAWTLRHIGIRTSWASAFKTNQRCRPRARVCELQAPRVCDIHFFAVLQSTWRRLERRNGGRPSAHASVLQHAVLAVAPRRCLRNALLRKSATYALMHMHARGNVLG